MFLFALAHGLRRGGSFVRFRFQARITAIVAVSFLSGSAASAWPHQDGQRVRAQSLKTSILIHGTRGLNQDTHLTELSFAHSDELLLARVVDEKSKCDPPSSGEQLSNPPGFRLHVHRDRKCDRAFWGDATTHRCRRSDGLTSRTIGIQAANGNYSTASSNTRAQSAPGAFIRYSAMTHACTYAR